MLLCASPSARWHIWEIPKMEHTFYTVYNEEQFLCLTLMRIERIAEWWAQIACPTSQPASQLAVCLPEGSLYRLYLLFVKPCMLCAVHSTHFVCYEECVCVWLWICLFQLIPYPRCAICFYLQSQIWHSTRFIDSFSTMAMI